MPVLQLETEQHTEVYNVCIGMAEHNASVDIGD